MKGLYPITITKDIQACAEFYKKNFGFIAVAELDWYVQLLHDKSGVEMAFMVPEHESQPKELRNSYNGKGVIISLEVTSAKHEYDRLVNELSEAMIQHYKEEEWGQKHFIIRDPSGMCVDVVEQAK